MKLVYQIACQRCPYHQFTSVRSFEARQRGDVEDLAMHLVISAMSQMVGMAVTGNAKDVAPSLMMALGGPLYAARSAQDLIVGDTSVFKSQVR